MPNISFAAKVSVPPLFTVIAALALLTSEPDPDVPAFDSTRLPPLTVVPPVKVLAPASVCVPLNRRRAPLPLMLPAKVSDALNKFSEPPVVVTTLPLPDRLLT